MNPSEAWCGVWGVGQECRCRAESARAKMQVPGRECKSKNAGAGQRVQEQNCRCRAESARAKRADMERFGQCLKL
eukprot:353388-Chlamydomonas_euryale.AAC.3